MYKLKKEQLNDLYTVLQKTYKIYGPEISEESEQVMFNKIDDLLKISLNAPIPHNPPKDVLLPQMETIMRYDYNSKTKDLDLKMTVMNEPTALIGLKSCDLEGILCLDRFFLGQEYVDDIYLEHRKNLFIVTITCNTPYDQCFCVCTDSGPSARENYDMNLTDMGDCYLCEIGSEIAEKIAKELNLEKAVPEDKAKKEKKLE
ncbi:MAG: hypothetical protein PF450_06885, partial [Bacteroidales bacterium]|nr:hypothetical protein [Bacteroidales bacterium]